jgi:hypothetical protein
MIISRSVRLRMRSVSDKFVVKIKTRVLCSVIFFSENRTVYEIMWKNIVEPDRPQLINSCMRFACWIPTATDIHSENVILIAFPLQNWLQERALIITLYVHCLSCLFHYAVSITTYMYLKGKMNEKLRIDFELI